MKTTIVALSILVVVLFGFQLSKNSIILNLREENYRLEHNGTSLVENSALALKLLKTRTWYVIDRSHLSSLPNGGGEKIVLLDDELYDRGNRMEITHVIPNLAVVFSLANEGNGYTVAGNQLTYEYVK